MIPFTKLSKEEADKYFKPTRSYRPRIKWLPSTHILVDRKIISMTEYKERHGRV